MIEGPKPYAEYKDSGLPWLGKVPEHWEVARLKRAALLNPSKTEAASELIREVPVTFLPMERVTVDGRIDSREAVAACFVWNGFTYFRRGDVIVAKITPCFENGKGACLDALPTSIGFGSTEFHVLRATGRVVPRYLYRLTTLPSFRTLGADAMTGAAGQQRVPQSFVANFSIALPTIAEQHAIVSFLEHADRRIRRYIRGKQKLIKLLEEQKQAIIHHAVTRGLDPNVRLKPSGVEWLGEVPAHWEVRKLCHCGAMAGGMTPSMDVRRYWDGEVPWVTPKDMKCASIADSSVRVSKAAIDETSLRQIASGSVLVVVRGMILARKVPIAWTTSPVTINQDMKALRPHGWIVAQFLAYSLGSAQSALTPLIDEAGHGTRRLPTERWREIAVALPPTEEQAAVAKFVERECARINLSIHTASREIDLLREYRTRLIADVVTGKLDVRVVAARLPAESEQSEPAAGQEEHSEDGENQPDFEAMQA